MPCSNSRAAFCWRGPGRAGEGAGLGPSRGAGPGGSWDKCKRPETPWRLSPGTWTRGVCPPGLLCACFTLRLVSVLLCPKCGQSGRPRGHAGRTVDASLLRAGRGRGLRSRGEQAVGPASGAVTTVSENRCCGLPRGAGSARWQRWSSVRPSVCFVLFLWEKKNTRKGKPQDGEASGWVPACAISRFRC